jgi:hypothetical protein
MLGVPGCCDCSDDHCDEPTEICVRAKGLICPPDEPPPVPGIDILVKDGSGATVGSCVTDSLGECCIPVDPGTYKVVFTSPNPDVCNLEVENVVVACGDSILVERTVACCCLVQITVIDYDTSAAIVGATIFGGWTEVTDGVFQKQFQIDAEAGDCFGPECISVDPPLGYHGNQVEIQPECGQIKTYICVLQSDADYGPSPGNWVDWLADRPGECCGSNDCDGGRRNDLMYKTLHGTPSATGAGTADALFGGHAGASIELTYDGPGSGTWISDCLDGGGRWRCWSRAGCTCDDINVTPGAINVYQADAGTGEDGEETYTKCRLALHRPNGSNCGNVVWNQWRDADADCSGSDGDEHCPNTVLADPTAFRAQGLGYCSVDPCASGSPPTGDCPDIFTQIYPQNFERDNITDSVYAQQELCGNVPNATLLIWSATGSYECVSEGTPPREAFITITE